MDSQLKKGLIEYCVLASLVEIDSYGYQIVKEIHPHLEITESTLYPILKRLETNKKSPPIPKSIMGVCESTII